MPFESRKTEYRMRLKPPKAFDRRSLRTKVGKCVNVIVGCPKGQYDARKKKCKVGTKAQAIRLKKKCYTESQARKIARRHGVG